MSLGGPAQDVSFRNADLSAMEKRVASFCLFFPCPQQQEMFLEVVPGHVAS